MNYFDVDTPAVLIDLAVTSRNIENYQKYCDEHGFNLRPHIKTHKIPELAKTFGKAKGEFEKGKIEGDKELKDFKGKIDESPKDKEVKSD